MPATPIHRVFSGIQPTGELHLGNYFGAIENWVRLQDDYECIYCVVDYHAITETIDSEALPRRTLRLAGDLIACGIDPQRSILFVQSHVPEHTELAWIFSAFAAHGDLTRMTQFKDKAARARHINVGLFAYPVLQAADILLYRADAVPVGEDQAQHLELTRSVARRFNHVTGADYFPDVQTLLSDGKRIMSLADPESKMSKSLGSKHYVGLMEPADSVASKIRSAVTAVGGEAGGEVSPGVANLLTLLSLCAPAELVDELTERELAGELLYHDLKLAVEEHLLARLAPIRERRADLDDADIASVLRDGADRARSIAGETIREVREIIGVGPGRLGDR